MKTLVILVGKAGSGKDTIANALVAQHSDIMHFVVSCTTRPKRDNEIEDVTYHYITKEQFAEKVLNGDMLEVTFFNDWYYGAAFSDLVDGINVVIFDPEGYECVYGNKDLNLFGYYIDCPAKVRMMRQLQREQNPNVGEIVRRYATDEKDFADIKQYDLAWMENIEPEDIQLLVDAIYNDLQDAGIC